MDISPCQISRMWVGLYLPVVPSLMLGKPFLVQEDALVIQIVWNTSETLFFSVHPERHEGATFWDPKKSLGRFQCKVVSWRSCKEFLLDVCHFYTRNHWGKDWLPFMQHQTNLWFRVTCTPDFWDENTPGLNKHLIDISLYLLVNRDPYMLIVSPKITKGSSSNHQFSGASC